MSDSSQFLQDHIFLDMSEGAMAIRFDGVIELVNDAALEILGKKREELEGRSFALCFFDNPENDAFSQSVLDAVYQKGRRQESYVPYSTGESLKQLRIVSSYLKAGGSAAGVILVISDITELTQMRDAVKAMEKIRVLNQQLELRNQVLQETFGRYLSDEVVREILASPDGWKLGGQKKKLTIMMSDLRGFTMLSEHMEPQDLIEMVNHYFSEMYEEIQKYNGTLIEFLGDGMFVIFGAPLSTENHAADAVAAALRMQRRMKDVNEWNAAHGFPHLSMGIGINSDDVILGNIGSEKRTKYGVLGAAVNLAGRIESYSTEGQILISRQTKEMIHEELLVDHEFQVVPKGSEEITITAVAGLGAPYSVFLEAPDEADAEFTQLTPPVPVSWNLLAGKHVDRAPKEGLLCAVSEQSCLLDPVSDHDIALYDNLCLQIGGDLYAKAIACENGLVTLRFTAKPECFEEWLQNILGK